MKQENFPLLREMIVKQNNRKLHSEKKVIFLMDKF